ncbi:MAG: hypothetical protein U9O90_07610 [Euryarchaeota archaeon]|nr:hypothetical protein [Euryarchaeota archaeon]
MLPYKVFGFARFVILLGNYLKSLLSSIPSHQQEESQARLIFETQLAYVVECTDMFVTEIIHKSAYPEIDKKPETELADAKYDSKINPLDFISSIKIYI